MKAAFVALCLASVALAQNIPTGTSASCAAFLQAHNADPAIGSCLDSLITATSSLDSSSGTANATTLNQALSNICSSSLIACPPATIRTSLTNFYAACSTELLGVSGDGSDRNSGVVAAYDSLYLILPLKDAICAKVDGRYCINNISSGPSSTQASQAASSSSASASAESASSSAPAKRHAPLDPSQLVKRTHGANLVARQVPNANGTNQEPLGPNADVYRESGLPYLFLQPNSTNICSECTAQVIGSYIRFETVTPYAIGIANSPILRGQVDLWEQIKQCPNGFAQGLLTNYTSTGNNGNTGGAAKAAAGVGSTLVAVFAAVGAAMLL